MSFMAWLGIAMAWMSLGAIALQTARGGGPLATIEVSERTRAAGRLSLRRGLFIALPMMLLLVVADLWLPSVNGVLAETVVRILGFAACPLVTFVGGAPLMAMSRNQQAIAPGTPPGRRVASLRSRDDDPVVPGWWWSVPLVIALSPLILTVRGPYTSATWTIFAAATAASLLFGGSWCAWAFLSARAPQDLSGAKDPEALDAACTRFRRFLVRGIFAMATVAIAGASAVAIAGFLLDGTREQGMWIGGIGGIGGGLIGTAGGVFGALADRYRRAILELGGRPPELQFGRGDKQSANPL